MLLPFASKPVLCNMFIINMFIIIPYTKLYQPFLAFLPDLPLARLFLGFWVICLYILNKCKSKPTACLFFSPLECFSDLV